MDDVTFEFIIWFVIVLITFIILNRYVGIRTAASIILSLLVASIIIYVLYKNVSAEIAISLSIILIFFYGITKSLRDWRDDIKVEK